MAELLILNRMEQKLDHVDCAPSSPYFWSQITLKKFTPLQWKRRGRRFKPLYHPLDFLTLLNDHKI